MEEDGTAVQQARRRLGWSIRTLQEGVVRRKLAHSGETQKGLSAGKTTRERLDRRPNSCGLPANSMVVAGTMEQQTQVHLSLLADH